MRILPVSLTTLLVELADLDETMALFSSLTAHPVEGIEEMVPAARTLMIRFSPHLTDCRALTAHLKTRDISGRTQASGTLVEIPVDYTGEDLEEVARLTGLTPEEVIRRHTESEYTMAFAGFAPGFGYLIGGDPALHVARRQTPRTKIPAGAVALAGAFSGVYPQASPGGWQIIGVTPLKMWDIDRTPPALLHPGCRVRFYDLAKRPLAAASTPINTASRPAPCADTTRPELLIKTAPMPAFLQDLGRFGQTGQGVSGSGALDKNALRTANKIVGNPAGTACLEITMGGLVFSSNTRTVIAVTGAPCPISITDSNGCCVNAQSYAPLSLEPGDSVTLHRPKTGTRSYLAVRGGFDVEPVLGSLATDTLAQVGPKPVIAGSTLAIGKVSPLSSVSLDESPRQDLPTANDIVVLDVILGPRTDWFTETGLQRLTEQEWHVTPQSNRVGIRLAGELPLERKDNAELPSEGTATGAIQVPHNGQPVLFLADHPLTGGYPVIGTVAEYHLDLAGQIPVNARIRFRPIRPFAEF